VRFTHKYLSDGSPISHVTWRNLRNIEVDPLDNCDYDWHYLIGVLSNKQIPYYDRQKKDLVLVDHYLPFRTKADLVRYVVCIVAVFVLFSALGDYTTVFIMMQNLLKALKEGKISKRVARIIIRRLLRKGVSVDAELISAAAE
jgi:hypothetical protein